MRRIGNFFSSMLRRVIGVKCDRLILIEGGKVYVETRRQDPVQPTFRSRLSRLAS